MSKFILVGLDGAWPDIIEKPTDGRLVPSFKGLRDTGWWARKPQTELWKE